MSAFINEANIETIGNGSIRPRCTDPSCQRMSARGNGTLAPVNPTKSSYGRSHSAVDHRCVAMHPMFRT